MRKRESGGAEVSAAVELVLALTQKLVVNAFVNTLNNFYNTASRRSTSVVGARAAMIVVACCGAVLARSTSSPAEAERKSKFYRAFVLNRRVALHAIDATPA